MNERSATGRSAEDQARSRHVDLSEPDNTLLIRGQPKWFEALWYFVGDPLLRSRWILLPGFRSWVLRSFGARIGQKVLLKANIRVKFPWYLSIGDHCWIGEDVWIDNLARVKIESNVCVSQGAYLCTGNHDWSTHNMKLFSRPITLCEGSWVGARSLVAPGVTLGDGAVAISGSVILKSIPPYEIYGGNPAQYLKARKMPAQ